MDAAVTSLPQTFYDFIQNIAPLLRTIDHFRAYVLLYDPFSTVLCVYIWLMICTDQTWFAIVLSIASTALLLQTLSHRRETRVPFVSSTQKTVTTLLRMNRMLRSCNEMFDSLQRVEVSTVPVYLVTSFFTLAVIPFRLIMMFFGVAFLTWHLGLPQQLASIILIRIVSILKEIDTRLDQIRSERKPGTVSNSLVPVTTQQRPSENVILRPIWYHEIFKVGIGWVPYDFAVDPKYVSIGPFSYGAYDHGEWHELSRIQAWARRAQVFPSRKALQ